MLWMNLASNFGRSLRTSFALIFSKEIMSIAAKIISRFSFLMSSFFPILCCFFIGSFVFTDITVIDILLPCLFFFCLCHSYKFFTANFVNSDLSFNCDGSFSSFSLNCFTPLQFVPRSCTTSVSVFYYPSFSISSRTIVATCKLLSYFSNHFKCSFRFNTWVYFV